MERGCPTAGRLAGELRRLVLGAAENSLPDFAGRPIFDGPLVGIVDGDDRVFRALREAVSPRHFLPREVLGRPDGPVRVLSWALPFSRDIIVSNRSGDWPSELYSVARNNGGALNLELGRRLSDWLRREGFAAISPVLSDGYDAFRCPERGLSSNWSERHVAYAAGLGRFGLNGCLITPRGAMVRLGSLVTDAPLDVRPRREADHRAPCLRDGGAGCGLCLRKCPAGAISSSGLDKEKCYLRRQAIRERSLGDYSGKFRMLAAPIVKGGRKADGFSLGCALCSSGVPCESADPAPGAV